MTNQEIQSEALMRATTGQALTNFPVIIRGFMSKGIAEQDIKPRENVFTYQAWRALNRQVKKGEHGVKVFTFIPMSKEVEKVDENGDKKIEVKAYSRPKMTTVFHISQTEETKSP